MEPRKQEPELVPQPQAEAKKRRFRLVKVEEQRFRIDKLEDRIAPLFPPETYASGVRNSR